MICIRCRAGIYHLVTSPVDEWNSESQQSHHQDLWDFETALGEGCYVCTKYHNSVNPHQTDPVKTVWTGCGPLVFKGQRVLGDPKHPKWTFCLAAQHDDPSVRSTPYWFDLYEIEQHDEQTSKFSSYVSPRRTDDVAALSLAKQWLRYCCDNHDLCRNPNSRLPTRLIDVQPDNLSREHVRLVDSRDSSVKGKYVTLSHRWGESRLSKLTVDSHSALTQGFLISNLSPIYQDAIRVTRFLEIRYLWIDSLCVLQDQVDTKIEAGKMASVFDNARCNLAALPKDSNTMFVERRNDVYTPRARMLATSLQIDHRNFTINDATSMKDEINNSALSRRAWVLQEQFLARRTIYFGSQQLMFHCLCSSASETSPSLRMPGEELQCPWHHLDAPHYQSFRSPTMAAARRRSSIKTDIPLNLQRARAHSDSSTSSASTVLSEIESEPLQEYLEQVEAYTLRELSHIEDKPLAIAGIATSFGAQLHDDYLCGLWMRSLGPCLLWQMHRGLGVSEQIARRAYPQYHGPSWSWLSVSEGVQFRKSPFAGYEAISRPTYHFEEYSMLGLAITENPYTSISPAWIHLRAPILDFVYENVSEFGLELLRCDVPDSKGRSSNESSTHNCITDSKMYLDRTRDFSLKLDIDQKPSTHHHDPSTNWQYNALFLQSHINKSTPPNIEVELQGLVLIRQSPVKQQTPTYIPDHMKKQAFFGTVPSVSPSHLPLCPTGPNGCLKTGLCGIATPSLSRSRVFHEMLIF